MRHILLAAAASSAIASADAPNATDPKAWSTEAVVAAISSCSESAGKRLAAEGLAGKSKGLIELSYCSCMTDALMAFPSSSATSKGGICMDQALAKAKAVLASGKDVEIKNLFSPDAIPSVKIQSFFISCIAGPKGKLTNLEQDLWCS